MHRYYVFKTEVGFELRTELAKMQPSIQETLAKNNGWAIHYTNTADSLEGTEIASVKEFIAESNNLGYFNKEDLDKKLKDLS